MDYPGPSQMYPNDILGDIVENFDLGEFNDAIANPSDNDQFQQVANIENPSTVACPEENLLFQLIENNGGVFLDIKEEDDNQFYNQQEDQLDQQEQQDHQQQGQQQFQYRQEPLQQLLPQAQQLQPRAQQLQRRAQQLQPRAQAQEQPNHQGGEGEEILEKLTGFKAKVLAMDESRNTPMFTGPGGLADVIVKIIEQPAGHKLRFRYECEGRSAGALQGASSTSDNKTFPTIKILGYTGPAVVVVSCVEENPPYRAHPHNLVGKGHLCEQGVCSMEFNTQDMTCQFTNMGIQCVKKKDAAESLAKRESIRVDPFKCGFGHKNSAINLNVIRLCFQVFLKFDSKLHALPPLVSSKIYDKKSHSDLQIVEISDDTSPCEGGKKIMIFCDKVDKSDIEIHFTYSTNTGETITRKGEFNSSDVHKQFGIVFRTPAFYLNTPLTKDKITCAMCLYKPSDRSYSEPVEFYFIPATREDVKPVIINEVVATKSNPKNRQEQPVAKQGTSKRPREPKQTASPLELSSGQVNVPPKQQPFRDCGGQVTINGGTEFKPSVLQPQAQLQWSQHPDLFAQEFMPQQQQQQQGTMPGGGRSMAPMMMVRNNLDAPGMDQQHYQQQPQLQQSQQQPESIQLDINSSDLSKFANAVLEKFPNLPIDSSDKLRDLSFADLEELSSNVNEMKLEKRESGGGGQGNEFQAPANYQQQATSGNLQTPDVSMEDFLRSVAKHNNLNKF